MRYARSGAAVCVAMVMTFVSVVRADEPDASTPKKAAVAFAKAVVAGDMATAKTLATGTEAEFAIVKSMSDMAGGLKRLEDAAVKKFGTDGKLPPGMGMDPVGDMESAEEKIDGDKATLILKSKPDSKNPPTLKKDGDDWKLDLSTLSKDPQNAAMVPLVPAMVKALDTVTKNIGDEKYKTPVELYTDLGQQLTAALTPAAPTEPAAK
jgi:hypothetical protein